MTFASDVQVREASADEKPILRQLLELYEYDFSEFEGTDVGPHGFYGYRYLDHYWTEPDRHPYLIHVDDNLAGFVLVNRHTVSGEERWSVAEFFVMRKYRRRGVGALAATLVFDLHPGAWEVKQVASHPGSTAFWRGVIGRYTGGQYEERQGDAESGIGPIQLFDNSGYAAKRETAKRTTEAFANEMR